MTRATTIPETITLHVPFRVVKRGGRKEMVLLPVHRPSEAGLTRPFSRRWPARFVGNGCSTWEFATMAELARRGGIAVSYLTRILGLTLLAPDIFEAILDVRQPATLQMDTLLKPSLSEWMAQRKHFLGQ